MEYRLALSIMIFWIILGSSVYACISIPKVETKSNCEISFEPRANETYVWKNETYVLEILNARSKECLLDENDIQILKDFVINGYSVKEQTDEEYRAFFEAAKEANEGRPENCLAYEAIHRNDSWTGYVRTGLLYQNGECIAPECGGGSANIIWNDLEYGISRTPLVNQITSNFYLMAFLALVVLVSIFLYIKRKSKKKKH
jgi:hypothetical protein